MTRMTRMTIMAYQLRTKKMMCTTVRQQHYKIYHQCCGNSNVQHIVGALRFQHTRRHMMMMATDQWSFTFH
eukprot:12890645-Prorocentrum_lima.AAC.1